MSLVKFELESMMIPATPREAVWPAIGKFLEDMKADRSTFFHLPDQSTQRFAWERELADIQPQLASRIPAVDTFLHVGIGGSSLGAETIVRALAPSTAPTFHFLDNIDPDHLWNLLEQVSPQRTLVYVVTKSGGTMETMATFLFLHQWLEKKLGAEEAKKHFVFCTDPEKGSLRKLSQIWNAPCFSIPPNLGGRFSALSAVGLFPALVAGIDAKALLKGAAEYRTHFLNAIERGELPEIADLAHRLVQHYTQNKRNVTVMMPYSQRLKTLGAWFTQLWAESLGKQGKGMTPMPASGPTDQHSILQLLQDGPADKVVGFVEIRGFNHVIELKWPGTKLEGLDAVAGITMNQLIDAELNATKQVLTQNQRPSFTLAVPRLNANTAGQILYALEVLTALAGYFMGINPFDQPGVEEGKRLTAERIRACKKSTMA